MLDWGDIRYFLALAREGSLSAAARRLKVDHTTIARRLDRLEAALGLRLFDRLARGWRPTQAGAAMLAEAEVVEAAALALERRGEGLGTAPGRVRLSGPPVVCSHFLAPHLAAITAGMPGLAVDLVGEAQSANLARGDADLALRLVRPDAPGLVGRRLATLNYGLYAAPAHVAGRAPADLLFLAYDDSLDHVPQQRWLHGQAAGRPVVMRTNDLASLHQAARAGLGVAALPRFLGDGDAALVRLAEDRAGAAARGLWLVVHPDLRRAPRVRAVMAGLVALVDQTRPLLEGR